MNSVAPHAPKSLWHSPARAALALLLLWLAFTLAVIGAVRTSITIDEGGHIVFGYSVLQTGTWELLEQHPPLVRELSAWPLLLVPDLPPAREMSGWAESDRLRMARSLMRYQPIDRVVFPVRVPVMLVSVLLGAFVFRWAADWSGHRAGLVALGLYALDPNILANAQVLTTDLGAACFIFIAMYFLQRFLRRPTWGRTVVAGVALGLSQSSKHSAALLLPLVFLLVIAHAQVALPSASSLSPAWRRRRDFARLILRLAALMAVAFLSLWATYGFVVKQPSGWPRVVPAGWHIESLLLAQQHMAEGHPAFLFGQVETQGWWWYFPFAFAIKTPLPTLILLGSAVVGSIGRGYGLWRQREPEKLRRWTWRGAMLGAFPLSFFVLVLFSSVDIGYRHLLPILPFIFVFVGGYVSSCNDRVLHLETRTRPRVAPRLNIRYLVLGALFIWYMVGIASVLPFPNGYFNELVGGPDSGWKYLADSNTEWGQSVKELKRFMDARGWPSIRLSLFTFTDPAAYGLGYEPLAPMKDAPPVLPARFNPPPGRYAISATSLDGIPLADPEQFDWFRRREPTAKVAHVMFVYDVPQPATLGTWVAQCTAPVTPLEPEQIAEGLGRDDLHLAYFDCGQSWLYPEGGAAPGWLVLARDAPAWAAKYLASARLSYAQERGGFSPPFRIYTYDGRPTYPTGGRVHVAPSESPLAGALSTPLIDLPVTLEGGLTLIGYALSQPAIKAGETLYLETTWRVDGVPGRLLSVMAHIVGEDGRVVAVGDGLGVLIESWRAGDVFVQRHALTWPDGAPPGSYWIQTGVYWLDNGERWPARDGRATGNRILLTALEARPR